MCTYCIKWKHLCFFWFFLNFYILLIIHYFSLVDTKMASNPPNKWLDEKMNQADASRMLGNDHFKGGRYVDSISMYNVSLTQIEAIRESSEALPMSKWNAIHVAGWLHAQSGESVATAFANAGIEGPRLASMSTLADLEGDTQIYPAFSNDTNMMTALLANIQEQINAYDPSCQTALDQLQAKVLSNRSLAKGKVKDHLGAMNDAKIAVESFPQWGKAYYRLGQCQLKLACLRQPNDPRMLDAARTTFNNGSNLEVTEHTSSNDVLTLKTQVRMCTQKLERILDALKAQIAAEEFGGDDDDGMTYRNAGRPPPPPAGRPPPRMPPSGSYNDVSILSCGLKDDHITLRQKLMNGASPNSKNQMEQSALHVASIWGALKVGRLLIEHGADVNAKNKMSGGTPLMMAAQRGRLEFTKLLLKNGANPLQQDGRNMLAYQYAKTDELRELLGGPTSKLFDVVREDNLKAVERIAAEHPELVAAEDRDGDTPLGIALWEKNLQIALYFCHHPAAIGYINNPGSQGETPLHEACKWENEQAGLQLALSMIKAGADVNAQSIRMDE
jgi:ankyrin repeat protein